ncbi:hypothetical protein Tco_0215690 [Tanacetum coccineum]
MRAKDIIRTQTCVLTKEELSSFLATYLIPYEYKVMLPKSNQIIFDAPDGYAGLYTHCFSLANLKLPFPRGFFNLFPGGKWLTFCKRPKKHIPPKSVVSPVPAIDAPRPTDPTSTPSSTYIDQDAPSASTLPTQETQSPIIYEGVEEQLQPTWFDNDPFQDILTFKPNSQKSSSNVQPANPPFEHLDRWTKDHPLDNVIKNTSRRVSTRCQLQIDAVWCLFDAILTLVEPKNYKEAFLESSWINAMQEEIHEFEQLQVWELIPRPDYGVISMYKVRLIYHDLYLGGKALIERENVGFDLTKSDICPSFIEDLTAKGVDSKVASLEAKKTKLKATEVSLRQELENARLDMADVVSKVVPYVAMELVQSDDMGKYPANVQVFPDPILFLAGLKPSWEYKQQRPAIIVGRKEMAFRNFLYAEIDDDLSFIPKEPSLDFGTGSPFVSINTEPPVTVAEPTE